MSDGSRLGELWNASLTSAEERFRQLVSSPSNDWKRAASPNQVLVHKHRRQDVYRAVFESDIGLDGWIAVLSTPELESEWDVTVEEAHIIQQVDSNTRVIKTKYVLGWPVSPRDSVTISRTHHSQNTVVHISTSLPRSPDEPAFLRPSPPYVRSFLAIRAWCIQLLPSGSTRITCFSQHDLRITLNLGLGGSFSPLTHLPSILLSLINTTRNRRTRIPRLLSWRRGVTIEKCKFENDREALTVVYSVSGLDATSIQVSLPEDQGWDVRLVTKASDKHIESLPWVSEATTGKLVIRHPPLPDDHSVLKVVLSIEISGPKKGLRLNGVPQRILPQQEQEQQQKEREKGILQDIASVSIAPSEQESSISASLGRNNSASITTGRTGISDKSIQARVKRNYIYFSSLLQEPEAKWKPTSESRGVTITQLDSIDPTLIVYRAEATFVGVGMWDMYAAVANYSLGAGGEEAILLRDMNEVSLSELWWVKFKGSSGVWGNGPRDAILLKTTYKSPNAIHVFSFSADDLSPPSLPSTPTSSTSNAEYTRTQIPLLGWSIESLSPNTTHLVLLEQSSVRGGSGVSTMGTLVAGIGESVIKGGAPPVVSRLVRGRLGTVSVGPGTKWKCEYAPTSASIATALTTPTTQNANATEIEIRCDTDTWCPSPPHSLDIVVDPPPSAVSVLRRHRLSPQGGGVWLNVTHCDLPPGEGEERVMVTDKDKERGGVVIVNGERVPVDYEEMDESEIRSAQRKKRVHPETLRVPLDQPPPPTRRPQPEAPEPQPEPPVAKWWSGFGFAQFQQTLASTGINIGLGEREAAPTSSKSPMHHLLDAYTFTRSFHANPLLASWVSLASSIPGLDVKKRVINEISEVHPVVKGEKVIEGVQAEDLVPLLFDSDLCCVGEGKMLETYLGGARSKYIVGKMSFPWRERGFWVVSGIFHQPSSATLSSSDNGVGATYVISTSFSPASSTFSSSLDANQTQLQEARLHLSAYILQTLDPYNTKENYAVPSTRVTRLLCVDWNTSVPVPSQTPSLLLRSFAELEKTAKGKGVWGVRALRGGLSVRDNDDDEVVVDRGAGIGYRYVKKQVGKGEKIFVDGRWVDERWRGVVSLSLKSEEEEKEPRKEKEKLSQETEVTPTASPVPRATSPSSSLTRKDRERERTTSSNATISTRGRSASKLISSSSKENETAWTVAEFIVDTHFKAFRDGYQIILHATTGTRRPIPLDTLFSSSTSTQEQARESLELPFQYRILRLPTDGLFGVSGSGSSSPSSTPREEGDGKHFISVTLPLPSTQPTREPIEDPLTGEVRNQGREGQEADWLRVFKDADVVLGVEVCPWKGRKGTVVVKSGKGEVVVDVRDGAAPGQERVDREGIVERCVHFNRPLSTLGRSIWVIGFERMTRRTRYWIDLSALFTVRLAMTQCRQMQLRQLPQKHPRETVIFQVPARKETRKIVG
ncbi:hypothetical protein Moror_8941 [Moniliophthora roreri MCA 2997]|uniref:START domain-containing protein n=1 Tax=Moniliophthora roreri (strain MCA 2997) TaxID=1381753 RepID=V2X1P4_MONRO|nr:hypothetical protein Moror_8941 [Moniliophthora roreri MCA 2997]